jgi:hypothetical protein
MTATAIAVRRRQSLIIGLAVAAFSMCGLAQAAPAPSAGPSIPLSPEARATELEGIRRQEAVDSVKRAKADRSREERTARLTNSVCIGCGGPVVPFNPSGKAAKAPAKAEPKTRVR